MYRFFLFLLLAFFQLSAQQMEVEDEIRVHLSTDQRLQPLYLGSFQAEGSSLEASYLEILEGTLHFDLDHNGSTKVLPRNREKEELISKRELERVFNAKLWRDWGVAYVIKTSLSDKKLSLHLFSVESGSLKHFGEVELTGLVNQDRRQIHKIADRLHKALFDVEGVANSRILYSVQVKSSQEGSPWISEIWECDWDGANAHQVTREGSYGVTPVFLPANPHFATDRFLYVSYKKGQPKIYIASIKEGKGERFIDLRGNQLLPAISPKRDKIAFICDVGGRTDLFVQPFHPENGELGKPVQLFSYPNSTQASPTFSPDGSKIAFVSDKDGAPRVYVIPALQSAKRANAVLLTKKNRESSCPAWSPDGKKLAYSARTDGVRQIWIYDFESKEERQLTEGSGNKENPVWAPDSLHLVFNSTGVASSELYLVNLNQPEAVKITQGPGKKHYPAWGMR
jgi:TolB protein